LLKEKVQKPWKRSDPVRAALFFIKKYRFIWRYEEKAVPLPRFLFLLTLKSKNVMKKMMLIVAVALAALSCANKAEKAEEAEAAPAPAAVEVAAPAPAEEQAPANEEQTLIERAVELGQDVATEVEKNK
jgi:hypothetical protein